MQALLPKCGPHLLLPQQERLYVGETEGLNGSVCHCHTALKRNWACAGS